jgi:hypothetical protein
MTTELATFLLFRVILYHEEFRQWAQSVNRRSGHRTMSPRSEKLKSGMIAAEFLQGLNFLMAHTS